MSQIEKIDKAELAKKIERRVQQKLSSGFYDQKEIDAIRERRLSAPDPVPEQPIAKSIDLGLINDPEGLQNNFDELMARHTKLHDIIATGAPPDENRSRARKVFNKFWSIVLKFTIGKILLDATSEQARFNADMIQFSQRLLSGIQKAQDITLHFDDVITEDRNQLKYTRATLNQRMNRLETFSDGADERLDLFDKKFETLSDQFTRLSAEITDLDKQGIFTRSKIEKLLRELKKGAPGELVQKAEEEIEKLKAHDYLLFENDHRGTREEIKQKAIYYAQLFRGKKNVVDIGCGRGELLELFSANKTEAMGIDINEEMVEECNSRGLKAISGSAIEYLENQPDGSLGAVSAIQVIEHLPTDSITTFFSLIFDKLEPGGIVAAETINPTALATFCGAFYLDMTHQKPIHPLALKFMLDRIGYSEVHIAYRNPFPEDIRLIPFGYDETIEGMGADFIIEYNRNVEKLNNVLFTHSDYAVIGVK